MSETITLTGPGKSRVRIARELKGLTQAQLAERVGRHIETVKAWDQGKHKPGSPEAAQQLADVLGVQIDWLFPPDEDIYVGVARTKYPTSAAPPQAVPEIPDPGDVLATLRPNRGLRHARLAPALALLATAAAIAVAVALATGSRPAAGPSAKASATTLATDPGAAQPPANADRAAVNEGKQKSKHAPRPAKRARRRHKHTTQRRRQAASHSAATSRASTSRPTSGTASPPAKSTSSAAWTPPPSHQPTPNNATTSHQASDGGNNAQGCSDVAAVC